MSSDSAHSLQILHTDDGSQTILNEELNSTYHSRHGAYTESQHIFIAEGLEKVFQNDVTDVTILEMGFGTGLNALLTERYVRDKNVKVQYHALELFPVPESIWSVYELPEMIAEEQQRFQAMHKAEWNEPISIEAGFELTKYKRSLLEFCPVSRFDLIYFDAFEPNTQPELWTEEVFSKVFSWMKPNGILTTYCCKGDVRRAMMKAGFAVGKIPGPPGKREMIRARRAL